MLRGKKIWQRSGTDSVSFHIPPTTIKRKHEKAPDYILFFLWNSCCHLLFSEALSHRWFFYRPNLKSKINLPISQSHINFMDSLSWCRRCPTSYVGNIVWGRQVCSGCRNSFSPFLYFTGPENDKNNQSKKIDSSADIKNIPPFILGILEVRKTQAQSYRFVKV